MKNQIPLEELRLSVRSFNTLRRAGFTHAEEVAAATEEELLSVRSFKKACLLEVRQKLNAFGLSLAEKSTDILGSFASKKYNTSEPASYNFPAVAAECTEIILRTDRLRVQLFEIADEYDLPLAALLSQLIVVVRKSYLYTAPNTPEACGTLLNAIRFNASEIRKLLDKTNEEHPSLKDADKFSRCDMLY